jgi:hypothetical protein
MAEAKGGNAKGWTGIVLAILAVGVALIGLPFAGGAGYAALLYPAFDVSCPIEKNDKRGHDDYRVYLLNRGCNVSEALAGIAADLDYAKGADRLKALVDGTEQPQNSGEESARDEARKQLHSFKPFSTGCPPGELCPSDFWGDDVISNFFQLLGDKYGAYAVPQFLSGLDLGADQLSSIAAMGPLAQGLLYLFYLVVLAVIGSAAYDMLKTKST